MFEFIVFLHCGHDTQVHTVKATWSQKWGQNGKPWNQWFALTFNKSSECCGFAPDHWQPRSTERWTSLSKARRTRTSSFHGKLDNVALCVICKRTIEHWDTGLLQEVLGTLESQANHLWWSRGPAAETGSCRWALWSDYGCWHPGESASSPWSPVASQRSHVFGT